MLCAALNSGHCSNCSVTSCEHLRTCSAVSILRFAERAVRIPFFLDLICCEGSSARSCESHVESISGINLCEITALFAYMQKWH